MEGLKRLLSLPENIKQQIDGEYGSIGQLYQNVFNLNQEECQLTGSNSPRLKQIENELLDIEDKLEEFGVTDGRDITSEIASDFGDIIVNKKIADLNEFLKPLGTDFGTMKKWLQDKYGI